MWLFLAVLGQSSSVSREDRLADKSALARMADGDQTALAELYDRHARLIFSLALRILQDRGEAEDVVQEVFTQAWNQAGRYDAEKGAVGAWMLMMARSRAIDRLRARRARAHEPVDPQDMLNVSDRSIPQDIQLLSSEQVSRLQSALKELPVAQRVALELAYYEGFTHVQIAERLAEPLGTIKSRIRQAVFALRESLSA